MLEDLIQLMDKKELDAFFKRVKIANPSQYDIANKNAIASPRDAKAMSRTVASLHTAFNTIAATTKNRNNIEKARNSRLITSTKEDYMEARPIEPGRMAVEAGAGVDIVGGVAKAISEFSGLLDKLKDALEKLDLSCNVCVEPCEPQVFWYPVPMPTPMRQKTGVPTRIPTEVKTPVSIPSRVPIQVPVDVSAPIGVPKGLPAPPATLPRTAPAAKVPQLEYQPLPEPLKVESRTAEKVRAPSATSPTARTVQGRTVAEAEVFRGTEGKTPEQIRAMVRARRAEKTASGAPQTGRQRWTADLPKEEYFERIRANQAQDQFAQRTRQPSAVRTSTPSPTSATAPRSGGWFSNVMTQVAESKVTKWGGRVLGALGVGADVYTRKEAGQSWGQVGAGVGGGLAGAAAGGKAGAAAGGALGAALAGVGAVPGAFIGGLIGGGLGYFGGSKLGDVAYEKVVGSKPTQSQQAKANERNAAKATKDLIKTTKQVQAQAKKAQKPKPLGFMGGVGMKIADYFNNIISSLSALAGGALSSVGSTMSDLASSITGSVSDTYYKMSGNIRENFKNVMLIAARYGDPHPEITAAQWALESAYGSKMSGKNNPFGQKARKDRSGNPLEPATARRTREVINGRDVYINDYFRDYDSVDQAIKNHVEKWTKKHTRAGTTPLEAIQAIKARGYATDPNYVNIISKVLASNNIDPTQPFTSVENAIQAASDKSLAGRIVSATQSFMADVGAFFGGTGGGQFLLPVGKARVTSGFGMRQHPTMGTRLMHNGIDFAVPAGTQIRAIESGQVALAGARGRGGWSIGINHPGGWYSAYAHLSAFAVRPGQQVQKGQVIGLTGGQRGHPGAGSSTGPHLHFGLQKNGSWVNPASYLTGASASPIDPQRGNQATEFEAQRKNPKAANVTAPARGGYLEDIASGNAVARRTGQRPKVVYVPVGKSAPQQNITMGNGSRLQSSLGRTTSPDLARLYFNR